VTVWSSSKVHRDEFVAEAQATRSETAYAINAVDHAGEAVVGADVIVLVTSSPTPVIESGWVKPGAHVILPAPPADAARMDPRSRARNSSSIHGPPRWGIGRCRDGMQEATGADHTPSSASW
jgi:ornithine cyclodeaminase/alanine dehydrogenase-like protein (mu-crystallin family)